MKYLLFSDVHWNTTSSIVTNRGEKYSKRLHRLIDSMAWINKVATDENCDEMICLGDFFDKSILTDEQATALKEINWISKPCSLLCGNHESSVSDLRYNLLYILGCNKSVIIEPKKIDYDNFELCYLPYIIESDRKPLIEYFGPKTTKKRIIISHNDIAGINYGGFESKDGFSIKEIEENCDLFLNGHLHNSEFITKKILNVGSISAHNFTNDSFKYNYGIWILDTDTLELSFIENNFGYSFYKIDINCADDLEIFNQNKLKNNAVLSIKCNESLVQELTTIINNKNITENYHLTIAKNITETSSSDIELLQGTDHIERLVKFCHEKLDNTDILNAELAELCK